MTNAWIAELAKGLTAGTQAYQSADQDRKARAKQDFEMGVTLLDPDMAATAFGEMQAPDPVTRWLGSAMGAKQPDTSKQQTALKSYLAMKRKEQEAALLKAQMAGLKNPMRLGPGAPVAPVVAPVPSLPPTTDQPLPLPPMAPTVPSSPMGPPVELPPLPAQGATVPEAFGQMSDEVMMALQDPDLTAEDRMRLLRSNETDADLLGRAQQTPFTPSFAAGAGPDLAQAPAQSPATPPPGNYVLPGVTINPMGLREPGNIDLDKRDVVKNPDGSISTVKSFSTEIDGKEVLLPLVIDGKTVSEADAVKHFFKTGEHLGKFATPEAATDYAKRLHEQQATAYGQPQQTPAPPVAQAPPAPVAATPAEPKLILSDDAIQQAGYDTFGEEPIDRRTALAIQRMERAKGYAGADVTWDFSKISMADAKEYTSYLGNLPNIKGPDGADPHYEWVPDEATGREKYVEVKPGMTRPGKTKDGKSRDKEWISIGYDDNGNEIEQYVWKDDQMPAPGPGNKPVANRLKKPKPTAPGARKRGYKSFGYTPDGKKEIFKYVYDDSDLPAPGPGGKPMADQFHTPRERQEDPAAKASRDLLNYTRIENILGNEFPMAINSASPGWTDKLRRRQQLLKRAGLPDDTGIPEPGKGVLDRLLEED